MLTFSTLKTVWDVVRCYRLLLRVAMDLNQCLTTYFDVLSVFKNFLGAHKHQEVVSKGPYKHQILPLKSLKPYKTTKNRWVLTFSQLKTVWSIARHRRWLLRLPKDLNKCLTSYFDVLSASENFFEFTTEEHCLQNLHFWANFGKILVLKNFWEWIPKNHQILTFSTLKTVWSVVRCHRLLLRVAIDQK